MFVMGAGPLGTGALSSADWRNRRSETRYLFDNVLWVIVDTNTVPMPDGLRGALSAA
jgi:hypothetical protein